MSMDNKYARKKLDEAYQQGVTKERARVLWLMDEERAWLRKKLDDVILVEATRHAMQVKIKIATSIYEQLKMRIIAGHEAPLKRPDKEKNICAKCGAMGYRYGSSCPHCDDVVSSNAPEQDPMD